MRVELRRSRIDLALTFCLSGALSGRIYVTTGCSLAQRNTNPVRLADALDISHGFVDARRESVRDRDANAIVQSLSVAVSHRSADAVVVFSSVVVVVVVVVVVPTPLCLRSVACLAISVCYTDTVGHAVSTDVAASLRAAAARVRVGC